MDHMLISGTEPSSVILAKQSGFKKLKSDAPQVANGAKAKRDGVMKPQNYNWLQNYNFNQF